MQRFLRRTNTLLAGLTGWLMMTMVLILSLDIVWRSFAKPLLGMAEMSVFVMMIVIYLGFAGCEEHGLHVRLELLENALPEHVRFRLRKVVQVLSVLTVAVFYLAVLRDTAKAYSTNDSIEGMISLPIWPTKFVMMAGMSVYLLQVVTELFVGPDKGPDKGSDGGPGGGENGDRSADLAGVEF